MDISEIIKELNNYEINNILENINEIIWNSGSPMQLEKFEPLSGGDIQRIEKERKKLFKIEKALAILRDIEY